MIRSVFLLKIVIIQLSYLKILAVLFNIPLKTQISVVVLLVEGFVQGAVRKELINVPFIKRVKAATLRRLEAAIGAVFKIVKNT